MALALVASRLLGVVRQIIFNSTFGTGPEANAYVAASRFPDTLFNLIAGGALTYAFIPVFLSYAQEKGDEAGWRLASLVLNILLVLMALMITIAEFVTPAFVSGILLPGYTPEQQALTTSLTRIMLLQPLMLGVSTVATAILSSRRQFLLPAISIAVYNFGLIGGLLVTKLVPGVGIYGPTYGVLVACTLQVLVQIPGLRKQGVRYAFYWDLRHRGLWEISRLLLPNALAVGVSYVALIVQTRFTSYLPDESSLAALHNAEMLEALPQALIGQAIGNSLLPFLALHATAGRYVRMHQTALKVIGLSCLLTIPAAIGIAVVGKPLISILYQHGEFNQHSSDLTNLALIGYAMALPGLAAGNVLVSGFYALKDALTPFLCNTLSLVLNIILLVVLVPGLPAPLAILSVPLALAGASTAEVILMAILLLLRLQKRKRQDRGLQRLERRRLYQQQARTAAPV